MQAIDLAIVGLYVLATIAIGLVARRRAAQSVEAYYLAGKSLPWYMLSLSNASGMFDISGTMWLVALCVVYGLKSIWIPWLWPVFNQVFLMVYLSTWLRRSNVLTGAEWIETRFGSGTRRRALAVRRDRLRRAERARLPRLRLHRHRRVHRDLPAVVAGRAVRAVRRRPRHVANFYGITFTAIAAIYAVLGGMFSIVWTDILQFTVMAIASVIVAVIAMQHVDPASLQVLTPEGWHTPFFGWTLDLDWSGALAAFNGRIASDGYTLFGAFMMMLLFKGVLVSAAGPAPNYDMQKILSTRSPREAALMSGFVSVVLQPIRYLMIAGLRGPRHRVLRRARHHGGEPRRLRPHPARGDAPVRAARRARADRRGTARRVRLDFRGDAECGAGLPRQRRLPAPHQSEASRRRLIGLSYAVSAAVVVVSALIGLAIPSINAMLVWIVVGAVGRIHGRERAQVVLVALQRLRLLLRHAGRHDRRARAAAVLGRFSRRSRRTHSRSTAFRCCCCCRSSVASSRRADAARRHGHAEAFYRSVRPWGFWGPVRDAVLAEDPRFPVNRNFRRDAFNIVIGTAVQTALVALPIYVVLRRFDGIAACLALVAVGGVILKKSWYDRLESD